MNKFFALTLLCISMIAHATEHQNVEENEKMVFVLVSDQERYAMLQKAIASIIATNESDIEQIVVFDLGLTALQRESLNGIEHVHVYDIELANPHIFTLFVVRTNGRKAKGWYSWKPIVLKQALEMFPCILYLDASTEIRSSLRLFFAHIRSKGYLFINCCHDGRAMTTQKIIQKFGLDRKSWVLNKPGMDAGLQGLTRAVYDNYVLPVYELAKDITNFEDDGTAPKGFGYARHDQAIFNVIAQLQKLEIKSRKAFTLMVSGKNLSIKFDDYISLKGLKGPKARK